MLSSRTQITILIDNEAREGLASEHGFSLWLEADNRHILFDTGQGGTIARNAEALGIDLGLADSIVLSHGHYDHSGGLSEILQHARKADLYCHPGSVSPRYSVRNGTSRTIRMPSTSMVALDRLPQNQLHWIQHRHFLTERIGLTGPIPRKSDFEDTGGPFFLDRKGQRADPIDDDLALWVRTDKGLVVIVGCAHAGLVNTLRHVQHCTDNMPIRAVIGGFHLLNATPRRLERTIMALRQFSPDFIVPCHCTGEMAVAALRDAFGDRILPGGAGARISF
jgi:7,8-dihydropterin-6-yl-methyl-4-(beta-D-ribofuranosyl)aminobenzene 5'-phosphate synthase